MAKYIDADLFWKRLGIAPSDWCKGETVKYALDNTPAAAVQPIKERKDCEQNVQET